MSKENILRDPPKTYYREEADTMDTNAFVKVVQNRRSVRMYTDEEVNEADLMSCMELALLAPTSSNLQPWEFYWLKDPKKKEKLIKYCLNQPAARTAKELIVCVARTDTWRLNAKKILKEYKGNTSTPSSVIKYYQKIVPIAYSQGLFNILGIVKRIVIALIGLRKPIPREPVSRADMRVWAHKTTALACQNLMLAVRAYGYDSCPMEGMDSKRIRKMLKLPKQAEICMVISVGKRAENGVYGKRFRLPSSEFIKVV